MSRTLAPEFPVTAILKALESDNLLPCILFRTARKQCDTDLEKLMRARNMQLPPGEQSALEREIDSIIQKYSFERDFIVKYPQYDALVKLGVGAHHAGQLLLWRLLLEELMTRSMLRMMIATGTVAAGVDFPARTVVVTAHSRRGSEGFSVLTAAELQQMAGRAGRRGKDAVGLCIAAPGQFCDARVILDVSKRPPEPLRSAYFAAPSSVLNLLKYRNVDDLNYTVARSLAAFLDRKNARILHQEAIAEDHAITADTTLKGEVRKRAEKRVRRKHREADELEGRQLTQLETSLQGLRKLGYVETNSLTEKGAWAAELCTSLVLQLGEAVADGLFDDCALYEMVGIVASIAGDPHRPYFSLKANPVKKELLHKMAAVCERVKNAYESSSSEVAVLPDAALTVVTWMDAENWEEFAGLLRLNGVADGDVSRLIGQTADHLNQLSRLEKSHPLIAQAAKVGRSRLLRPPFSEVVAAP
jgi:ATP-dependent RNA helicase HelY